MFRVEYDARANVLGIAVSGFWTLEDVRPLAAAIGAKVAEARAIRGDFDVLVDSREFPVQGNAVADLLANIPRAGMTQTTGRAAIVVASQLNKLQVERTLAHPRLRAFLSIDAARDWLAGD
jgi:hypothetical protein